MPRSPSIRPVVIAFSCILACAIAVHAQTVPIAPSPTGATESGVTVTITTTVAHGFSPGAPVTITGVGVAAYNGTFAILLTPTPTTFTYTVGTPGLASSGGGTASVPVIVPIAASPTGATESGTTVTITTTVASGFAPGASVTIAGVGVAAYNGTFTILTTPTPTTFTYTVGTAGLASSGGGFASSILPLVVAPLSITLDPPYQVRYAANLASGTSYVDIVNDGLNGVSSLGPGFGTGNVNMCANLYFFDPGEELVSCCQCQVTPDQTVGIDVVAQLTNGGKGTINGTLPGSVTIKVVGSSGNCATNNPATTYTPAAGLIAFGTTLHQTPTAGTLATTETPFSPASLSASELTSLQDRCSFIVGNDSTYGQCSGCPSTNAGALGAAKQ